MHLIGVPPVEMKQIYTKYSFADVEKVVVKFAGLILVIVGLH